MVPNSLSPSFQPEGCVRPVSKVKGDLERIQEPASNRLFSHVSLPWDGRSMGDQVWGMLTLAIFRVPFFRQGEKWLEATSRAGMGHILGPQSQVSTAFSVRLLLTMVMEIWHHECGPFWPNFTVFAILGQVGNAKCPWRKGPSQEGRAILVAYDEGSMPYVFAFARPV